MKQFQQRKGLLVQALFVLTVSICGYPEAFAQTSATTQCDMVKQVLFLVDVSGSMETNDRLKEVKQFILRTTKESSAKNYLYKLISFGGSCNEIQTDVDWTRDGTVFSAGVKGLYLRGGTPLGSAIEFTIDEIKKSAYPDQTKVILLNDGANACGEVSDILTRRLKEIPCVRFVSIGIELDDDENGLASRAIADVKALAAQTGGSYVPLRDVREIRGVSLNDSAVVLRPVEFEPRKKLQATQQPAQQPRQNQSQPAQSSAQSSQTASQAPANTASPSRSDSSIQAEKQPQNTSPQSASSQSTSSQTTSSQTTSSEGVTPKERTSTPASASEKTSSAEPAKQENRQSSSQPTPKADSRPTNDSVQSVPSSSSQPQTTQADKSEVSAPSARAQGRNTVSDNQAPQGYNAFRTQGNEKRMQGNESRMQGRDGSAEAVILRFVLGSTRLLDDSRVALARLEMELRARPVQRIEVDGHSSGEGSSAANLRLSVERASAIANILRKQTGMSEERIRWTGYGELRPAAGAVRFGNAASRCVEIRLYR
ncbi:MAG: OmpA family protein [Ignavibacteria bacterium]|nr:OmpA family protein [Ignavibacteria bacterium]